MSAIHRARQVLIALSLACVLMVVTACSSTTARPPQVNSPQTTLDHTIQYGQLERGNSASAQAFGDWVVDASKGLIQDAYVRDDRQLGVVISKQVRLNEVKNLTRSLTAI
jgi:hypothetical protein